MVVASFLVKHLLIDWRDGETWFWDTLVDADPASNAASWQWVAGSGADAAPYFRVFNPVLQGEKFDATVDINYDGTKIAVDTGFIVYNGRNYPNLTEMFAELGVTTQWSDMSLGISVGDGSLEWSGDSLKSVFAQKRNAISPRFLRMLLSIVRFNRQAMADLTAGRLSGLSLRDYLRQERYSSGFIEDYLVPMGAAIWSTPDADIMNFPAQSFVQFFANHRLLEFRPPEWRTVTGGSRNYVEKLLEPLGDQVLLGRQVTDVRRTHKGVQVTDSTGDIRTFDGAILACHSDQSLGMLKDASDAEASILSAVQYRPNDVYLHRDEALMPKRKTMWSAWNYMATSREGSDRTGVSVSYWMNKLQGIDHDCPLFITLNPDRAPDPDKVFLRTQYDHPQFDAAALAAQQRLPDVQVFNPLSVYYGYDESGALIGVIYEVRNTFGERHSYVARVEAGQLTPAGLRQERGKLFFVSPLMDMAMRYTFNLKPPAETITIRILENDNTGPILSATFHGEAVPVSTWSLFAEAVRVPFLTAKVVGAIHYEALRLWLKGIKLRDRPPAPPAFSVADGELETPASLEANAMPDRAAHEEERPSRTAGQNSEPIADLEIHSYGFIGNAQRNISAHYDLGNAFYEQWLDPSMTYSSALFQTGANDMQSAQKAKYAALADATGIQAGDRVLEIGCGWGGFAEYLATERGAYVTGLTISQEQYDYARERMEKAGIADQVDIVFRDYRDEKGVYDRIVSVEMFEAVGEAYWPTYYETLKKHLKPGGKAGLQIITIQDRFFEHYRHATDFIQQYVFPGGQISDGEGRLDFDIEEAGLDKDDITNRLQTLIDGDHKTSQDWITDAELDANPDLVKTMSVKPPRGSGKVRLIRIGGMGEDQIDLQPCGGTHVASTAEIGKVEIRKIEKKGKQNRRVRLRLIDDAV
eukprot:g17139.t1